MRVVVVVVVKVECVMIGVTQYVPLSFHTLTFFLATLVDEQLGLGLLHRVGGVRVLG